VADIRPLFLRRALPSFLLLALAVALYAASLRNYLLFQSATPSVSPRPARWHRL